MARDYDVQLLESVAARRERMRQSLLWGRTRRRRATADNLKRFAISVVVAAVASAGCVAWSFVRDRLADQQWRSMAETSRDLSIVDFSL